MKSDTFVICYENVKIGVTCSNMVKEKIISSLQPFFHFIDHINEVDQLLVSIEMKSETYDDIPTSESTQIKVDTSLYKQLASEGTLWDLGDTWIVNINLTNSWFEFDRFNRLIKHYQTDLEMTIIDIVRLIKGITTTAIENDGYVQLHSSAVHNDLGTTLILGDMWQGKTSLLLELMSKFNVSQLSCDTIVLGESDSGGLVVRGWPSPFSMSHGAMADYPELHDFIPPERLMLDYDLLWKEGKKTVLSSDVVTGLFGSSLTPFSNNINTCLIARFNQNTPVGLNTITDVEELEKILRMVYLGSRDPIYHNWHRYVLSDDDLIEANIKNISKLLIENVKVIEFNWAPSAESLFKRIGSIARQHKTCGSLFENM